MQQFKQERIAELLAPVSAVSEKLAAFRSCITLRQKLSSVRFDDDSPALKLASEAFAAGNYTQAKTHYATFYLSGDAQDGGDLQGRIHASRCTEPADLHRYDGNHQGGSSIATSKPTVARRATDGKSAVTQGLAAKSASASKRTEPFALAEEPIPCVNDIGSLQIHAAGVPGAGAVSKHWQSAQQCLSLSDVRSALLHLEQAAGFAVCKSRHSAANGEY
jgi:hypothetical protein